MKKCLLSLLALCLCSCGSQPSESEPVVSEQAVQQETTIQVEITEEITTEEATESETEAATDTEPKAEVKTETKTEDPWAKFDYVCRDKYTEPIKLYDNDIVSISCQGWAVADDAFSAKFEIENKSDHDINVKTENTSINDYDLDIYLYDYITAGKKKILYAEASPEDVQKCSLSGKDINHVEFRFRIKDKDTFETIHETDIIPIDIIQE